MGYRRFLGRRRTRVDAVKVYDVLRVAIGSTSRSLAGMMTKSATSRRLHGLGLEAKKLGWLKLRALEARGMNSQSHSV
jgi:hypothetical protein